MVIGQTQTYLGLLAFTAMVGGVRGWRREVITAAVLLAALMFVSTGGGVLLANLFTHGTGSVAQSDATTSYTPTPTASCVEDLPAVLANLTFAGLTFFGYRMGRFVVSNAGMLTSHRIVGMVVGAVNGGIIGYYISTNILHGGTITLGTPGPIQASAYLPLVLGLGIVGVLAVAFIMGQARKGRAGGEASH